MSAGAEHKLDLLERVKRDGIKAPEPTADENRPLVPRELPIEIVYVDPDTGKRHEATVISRIMDGDELGIRDRAAAAIAGGPWSHLPPMAQTRAYYLATVSVQLRDPPAWVRQWIGQDDDLLWPLGIALEDHSARYFRRDARAGEEDTGQRRVAVRPVLPS